MHARGQTVRVLSVARSVVRNAWNCNGSVTMWTVWDGVVDTAVGVVCIMCVRGRVSQQIGEVIMAVNVVCSDPLDGRAWTIVDPVMEGMGWHVVRVEEDCYTLTTIAVADSEGDAVDFVRAALLGGAE